jgi:hypothetical protein
MHTTTFKRLYQLADDCEAIAEEKLEMIGEQFRLFADAEARDEVADAPGKMGTMRKALRIATVGDEADLRRDISI